MTKALNTLITISLIMAFALGIIIIIQIIKILLGRSWEIENIILTLIILNISLTFGLVGYVAKVDKIIHGHIQWHKGKDVKKI